MLSILGEPHLVSIFWTFAGIGLGIFFGALPGFGGSSALAVVLPIAISLSPLDAMIFMIGIHGGGFYGGGIPSILVGVAGEAGSAATVLDGFQMTRNGRGAEALAMMAIGSAIAGIFSIVCFLVFAPPLARAALSFGPPELFMLVVFGLTVIGSIDLERMVKALFAGGLGLLIASIGTDPYLAEQRLVFDIPQIYEGLPFIPSLLGLFCISQMLVLIDEPDISTTGPVAVPSVRDTLRGMAETFKYPKALAIGSIAGTLVGALPGAGATIASFVSYNLAKTFSRSPQTFGKGNPEGLIAPESANNSVVGGDLIPTFALGIPGSGSAAVLMSVMMYLGLRPGPQLFVEQWPLIQTLAFYLLFGCVLMILFGLFAVGFFFRLTRIPLPILVPCVIVGSSIGAYSFRGEFFDLFVMMGMGLLGYLLEKKRYPLSAVVLGLVLGPMAEEYLVQSLELTNWHFSVFFTRPICLVLWAMIAASVISAVVLYRKSRRMAADIRAAEANPIAGI
jgi:putative tricarboxylic transport membrane protein